MSLSILYVEDNEDLREALTLLLEAPDREVVGCGSAEAALQHLQTKPFDVLVLDQSLPGLSGEELARRVLAERPEQVVILCSGFSYPGDPARLGPRVRTLVKPFEVDVLERMIIELTRDRR